MDRVWAANASLTPPTIPVSLELGYPKATGPATVPGPWWYHMVTEEIRAALVAAGLVPSSSDINQLSQAIAIIAKQSVLTGAAFPVRVIDNIGSTLSFAQTVDNIALTDGDRVLRNVSPPNTANGVYVVNTSGAWTRASDFPLGSSMREGLLFSVAEGDNNKGTVWQLNSVSGDAATIGTTAILFGNITDSLNAKLSLYLLASSAAVTYAPLTSPAFSGLVTLNGGAAGAIPYLNNARALVSDGALTFDGTNFATTGKATAGSFTATSSAPPVNGLYLPATNTLAWSTNTTRRMSLNAQGNFAVGTVSGIYQAQVTGAGQGSAALADGGATGAALLLQDSNASAGAGGVLLFGTALGSVSPFAAIKGLLTDTGTGKVGHLAMSVRSSVGDTTLTEVGRLTSTRNLLIGTTIDSLGASAGNLVVNNRILSGQTIGITAGNAGQVQAIGGSAASWYNAMLRNDGVSAALMATSAQSTAVGAIDVAANAYRPFSWNLANGQVTIDGTGSGTAFGGPVSGITAATNDNSTKFATTALVAAKIAAAAIPTVGTSVLAGDGSGGFTNVTLGAGLSYSSGTLSLGSGVGTVTSIAVTVPSFLSVTGSPITASGTIAVNYSGTALPVLNGGTGVTTSTGAGNNVLSNSPVLVTPNLGVPSAITLTNATGLPLSTGVTGTLGVVNGGTGVTTSTGTGNNVLSVSPALTGVPTAPTAAITDSSTTIATTAHVSAKVGSVRPIYISQLNNGLVLSPGIYLTDTYAGAFTVSLPPAPTKGDCVEMFDGTGTWNVNNLTVLRNGHTIMGSAEDLVCNVAGENFRIWYNGTDWRFQ